MDAKKDKEVSAKEDKEVSVKDHITIGAIYLAYQGQGCEIHSGLGKVHSGEHGDTKCEEVGVQYFFVTSMAHIVQTSDKVHSGGQTPQRSKHSSFDFVWEFTSCFFFVFPRRPKR